jgi:hypothetical protein
LSIEKEELLLSEMRAVQEAFEKIADQGATVAIAVTIALDVELLERPHLSSVTLLCNPLGGP